METEKKKFNPYIIITIVLLIAVGAFAYDKWGKGFLPASVEGPEAQEQTKPDLSKIDTKVTEQDIVIGNAEAPVTIVEYYSYFCSYCKLFHEETYSEIVKEYIKTGKVKFVFRSFPPFELGVAALCAKEQDKFLEYHDELFVKAGELKSAEDLKPLAETAGLDTDKFNQCFDSGKYLSQAELWANQGDKDFETIGVPEEQRGTPAFFINGELILGAHPFDKFVEMIEAKLSE